MHINDINNEILKIRLVNWNLTNKKSQRKRKRNTIHEDNFENFREKNLR